MAATYPLLFTFLDKVEGDGYLPEVAVHGRLLAVQEDEGWWMYGVNPGGLAASGKDRGQAYAEFRKTLMEVLFDIASDAPDFYTFRKLATKFFGETNEPTLKEWEAARQQVRAGSINVENMQHETAESPRRIDIKQKQTFAAKSNTTDPQAVVAA